MVMAHRMNVDSEFAQGRKSLRGREFDSEVVVPGEDEELVKAYKMRSIEEYHAFQVFLVSTGSDLEKLEEESEMNVTSIVRLDFFENPTARNANS